MQPIVVYIWIERVIEMDIKKSEKVNGDYLVMWTSLKKHFSINLNSIINLSMPFLAMISLLVYFLFIFADDNISYYGLNFYFFFKGIIHKWRHTKRVLAFFMPGTKYCICLVRMKKGANRTMKVKRPLWRQMNMFGPRIKIMLILQLTI